MVAVRALQNPNLFKYEHFRQAALAVAAGVVIQLIIQIPVRPSRGYDALNCCADRFPR